MTWFARFYFSNIGLKVVMALTGAGLAGFVLFHMLGNLQVFWGEELFNAYARFLHDHPTYILWPGRIGLLTMAALHIHASVVLTRRAAAARPQGYRQMQRTNKAATFMRLSGVIVLLFIIYHLLHFTIGLDALHPSFQAGAVHQNVHAAFTNPVVVAIYVVCNALLGVHLWHGTWSLFRTLGVSSLRGDQISRIVATALTATIVAGNIFIPLAVFLRIFG